MIKLLIQKAPTFALIAILAAVGFFAYDFFNQSVFAQDSNLTVSTNQLATLIDPASEAMLDEISSITLDTSIFSNPVFLSLNDYTNPLPQESAGRTNPFAPYPGLKTGATSSH